MIFSPITQIIFSIYYFSIFSDYGLSIWQRSTALGRRFIQGSGASIVVRAIMSIPIGLTGLADALFDATF